MTVPRLTRTPRLARTMSMVAMPLGEGAFFFVQKLTGGFNHAGQDPELKDRPAWEGYSCLLLSKVFAAFQLMLTHHLLGKYWAPQIFMPLRALLSLPIMWGAASIVDGVIGAQQAVSIRENWTKMAVAGIIGIFGGQLCAVTGLSMSPAFNFSLLSQSVPVFTTIICLVIGLEGWSLKRLVGIALAIAGALIMLDVRRFSFSDASSPESDDGEPPKYPYEMLGNLLFLLAAACGSIMLITTRMILISNLKPLTTIALLTTGTAVLGVVYGSNFWALNPPLTWTGLGGAVAVAATASGDNMLTNVALARVSPVIASLSNVLLPPLVGLGSYIFLNEPFTMIQVGGGVCIILGMGLVIWARHADAARDEDLPSPSPSPGSGLYAPLLGDADDDDDDVEALGKLPPVRTQRHVRGTASAQVVPHPDPGRSSVDRRRELAAAVAAAIRIVDSGKSAEAAGVAAMAAAHASGKSDRDATIESDAAVAAERAVLSQGSVEHTPGHTGVGGGSPLHRAAEAAVRASIERATAAQALVRASPASVARRLELEDVSGR